ncbi:methyltransferase domain-containing protein [Actinomadura sp. NEAU-AAG7]|uniref:methyltransferase domain-containing protein n=1 Tax=Actinomadura sp. NEAU-AAG7 TaxID=2839640 RepID=UPI001BE45B38|nr:methyltransferase domain-containing protein [Actinomadura sp. NEAU-AAG7]MBT2207877.1 methyltransferase domain-containing protein [Actinomadura sp. NEAU-AAG7]
MIDWHEVFEQVPRSLFAPPVFWADLGPGPWARIDRDADSALWAEVVARDQPLVIQFEDGHAEGTGLATSSLSMPTVVAEFLSRLDPLPHDRVLEIGTGSGWTAALLSSRPGVKVTSVEVDPDMAAQAAKRLKGAGFHPRLIVGDGAEGWPPGAPYDRVHATCAVTSIPNAWIEQTRPGGVIVAPYSPGFGCGTIVRLDVLPDGAAIGRFCGSADYMLLRSHRPAGGRPRAWVDAGRKAAGSATRLDPRLIRSAPVSVDLVIATLVPGVVSRFYEDIEQTGEATLWVLDARGPGGAWASVDYVPGHETYRVEQAGDRALWEEVEDAYAQWLKWGRPDITRFGMTVTPQAHTIWLDDPSNIV